MIFQMKEGQDQKLYQLQKGSSLVNTKYKVIGTLGTGSASTVHSVSMIKGERQIIRAAKVESTHVKEPQITNQILVLNEIKQANPDEVGFATAYEYGLQQDFNFLILSMHGPNLEQLLKLCGGTFSLKTTIICALQILDRIQTLHGHGFVYCDVRPDNFLVGLGAESPIIFMVDMGHCRRYRNKTNGQHVVYKQNITSNFNPAFASINIHNKVHFSRRDDIESLIYLIIYMRQGRLPWTKPAESKRKMDADAQEIKKKITPQMLCHRLPLELIDMLYYTRSIEFYEKPDYDFLRRLMYRCLQREEMDYNLVFDWNKLEEVDFKVYSGDPKIVLKTDQVKVNDPHEVSMALDGSKEEGDEESDKLLSQKE